MNFTDNEIKVLRYMGEEARGACCAETFLEARDDYCAPVEVKEIQRLLGWNQKQVGGIMTSLAEKGAVLYDEEALPEAAGWWLEDHIFELLEEGGL